MEDMIRLRQAALECRVPYATLRFWITKGWIHSWSRGPRSVYVSRAEVEREKRKREEFTRVS